jgi:hypothetical protein
MQVVLEFALLMVGIFFGNMEFSLVILPLIYGIPKSFYWAAKGWLRWRTVLLYLISPVLWSVVLLVLSFLLLRFAPAVAQYLSNSEGFAVGQLVGILLTVVRAIFSRSTRTDMTDDFMVFVRPQLTDAGRTHVAITPS